MGVVFGVLGGYYYWSPKFIGYQYNEFLGLIQFWSLFIGVNLTFLPMHFTGLAGMPRRICDYPETYGLWNTISSYGSIISFLSLLFFIFIIYRQISDKIKFYTW
jgi:heme/copper-type cytochrome/quinol oxidase subunit 1